MLSYLENNGFVYVFENTKTNRIKVGMTGVSIESRLKPLNQQYGNTTYINGDKNLPISYWKFRIAYKCSRWTRYFDSQNTQKISEKPRLPDSGPSQRCRKPLKTVRLTIWNFSKTRFALPEWLERNSSLHV